MLAITKATITLEHNSSLESQIIEKLETDTYSCCILQALDRKDTKQRKVSLAKCNLDGKLLLVNGLIYVPDYDPLRFEIIHSFHDSPLDSHPGRSNTSELVSRNYWWPGCRKYLARYVDHCQICSRSKATKHAPFGQLNALEVPERPGNSISMNFITSLPESECSNAILVLVDRLSKMGHYILCRDSATAADVASLYLQSIWKLHGLPRDIVSDHGTQFTFQFWAEVCKALKIKCNLSTACHPQIDGPTERRKATLEQYLRRFVDYQQDNWCPMLP